MFLLVKPGIGIDWTAEDLTADSVIASANVVATTSSNPCVLLVFFVKGLSFHLVEQSTFARHWHS